MTAIEAVFAGVALAACAGLRAFLPLFATGVAIRLNGWPDPPILGWIASDEGLVLLAVATLAEIAADKVPWLDNLMDTVETLAKPLAGFLVALGMIHHLSPGTAWVVAVVVAAPTAATIHLHGAGLRAFSSGFTGGLANPLISLIEDLLAGLLAVAALVAPFAAVLLIAWLAVRVVRARRRRLSVAASPPG